MKKKHVILMVIILLITLIALIMVWFLKDRQNYNDGIRFQTEYESLNGKKNASGKEYLSMDLSYLDKIEYATYEQVMDILDGTGVIYFGFPECPWCRNAVPVLLEAANETSIDKIYYYNALEIRDQKKLDENGNIIIEKEGTKEYYDLVDRLSDVLNPYEGLNDSSIKRLYFPTVIFVKDGNIIGVHEGTLQSQEDPYTPLTELQSEELKKIYTDYIHEILDDMCDTKC